MRTRSWIGVAAVAVSASALTLVIATGLGAAPSATRPLVMRIKVPPPGGAMFARYRLVAAAGAQLPVHVKLRVLNKARLALGVVAVALTGRLKGRKPGFDIFVAMFTKRGARTSAALDRASPDTDPIAEVSPNHVHGYLGLNIVGSFLAKRLFTDADNERPPSPDLTRADPEKSPGSSSDLLLGPLSVKAGPLIAGSIDYLEALENAKSVDDIIGVIERSLGNDMNGDGKIGAPAAPRQLYEYSFGGLGLSWDAPGGHNSLTKLAGTVCGDPMAKPWRVTYLEDGLSETAAPVFSKANPTEIGAGITKQNGAEVARITFLLRFFAGTGPTMTLEATTSGQITNLVIDKPATVPVAAKPVASCP